MLPTVTPQFRPLALLCGTLQPLENPFGARDAPTPNSNNMKAPGETEASNAGEQLAKG